MEQQQVVQFKEAKMTKNYWYFYFILKILPSSSQLHWPSPLRSLRIRREMTSSGTS